MRINNLKSEGYLKHLLNVFAKEKSLALVIGLEQITGLNTVRSLHREGVPTIAITSQPRSALSRSNMCKKIYCEDVNGNQLIETLQLLGKYIKNKPVLMPTSDTQVELISNHRELLLDDFLFYLPEKSVVDLFLHKTKFASFAKKYNFEIPKTFVINNQSNFISMIEEIDYPCIVKPFERTLDWDRKYPNDKVLKIGDERTLREVIPGILETIESLIIQEWIEGHDSDVYFCLMYFDEKSEHRASFVGKKIRQWLPETGSTASAEECFDKTVFNESIRLFKAVGYRGLGSVEFKFDRQDQKFKIMEPTVGRPNLQSYISVVNGINIPYIYYRDITGQKISTIDNLKSLTGVKWINEWAEFESARYYMKKGDLDFSGWLKSLKGKRKFGLFSIADPLPFFFTLIEKIKWKLKKVVS